MLGLVHIYFVGGGASCRVKGQLLGTEIVLGLLTVLLGFLYGLAVLVTEF
jgi:hypothetical protein